MSLGLAWMQQFELIFDVDNERVGFVKSNCSRGKLSKDSSKSTETIEGVIDWVTNHIAELTHSEYYPFISNNRNLQAQAGEDCDEQLDYTSKEGILTIFCAIQLLAIIFLILGIRKFSRGENFLCFETQTDKKYVEIDEEKSEIDGESITDRQTQ